MANKFNPAFLYNLILYFAIALAALAIIYYIFPDIKTRSTASFESFKNEKNDKTQKKSKNSGTSGTSGTLGNSTKVIKLLEDKPEDCVNGCNHPDKESSLHKIYIAYTKQRNNNKKYRQRSVGSSPIGPANIFIVRHGERSQKLVSLNCNGMRRAVQMVNVIEKLNSMKYSIDYIITSNPDLSTASMHLEQTVMMSAWLMDIPLFIFGQSEDSDITINNIYSNSLFNNKNILICWDHTCIQTMLKNILTVGPATKKIPNKAFLDSNGTLALPYWDKNNYRSMIQITEDFEDIIYDTGVYTCQKGDNDLQFGIPQSCEPTK
jgi:hypothetical protein